MANECTVQLRTPVTGSTEWAGLESGEQVKVGDLLAKGFPPAGKYLFDWNFGPEMHGNKKVKLQRI